MDKREDGGPAFPTEAIGFHCPQPGMKLRDWFAGQALAGLMADSEMNAEPLPMAHCAYNYADAMLSARKVAS